MNTLVNKNIVLGVTGGIAAYKSADLVRRLREAGCTVRVVMTQGAQEFITSLTLQAVSGHLVHQDLFDLEAEAAMGHIELARWADAVLVAPASADFIARLAYGHANDLLTTLCLATTAPLLLAPAMNQQMWLNAITQENIQRLRVHGVHIVEPAIGSQACGETGPGRLPEVSELVIAAADLFVVPLFQGESILITAGPTHEIIDPVRYIANRSSGKMGYALAEAAMIAGAKVILISGPVNLAPPSHVDYIAVKTAEEMLAAVLKKITNCTIFIGAAAVADYRCATPAKQKIAKIEQQVTLKLIRNPDILTTVSNLKKRPFTVGFAAETKDVIRRAKDKLKNKKLDLIVANQVGSDIGIGFESDNNQLTLLWQNGKRELPFASKKQLAKELIALIAERYFKHS